MKLKRIRSFINYTGGKYNEFPIIWNYMPDKNDMKVIDVFGGGGSVLWNCIINEYGSEFIYNDINIYLYQLFKYLFDEKERKKIFDEMKKVKLTKENCERIVNDETNYNNIIIHLAKSKICFKGIVSAKIVDSTGRFKFDKTLDQYYDLNWNDNFKDKNVKFENKDFKIILEKYKDDENAFLYLDPPYISKQVDQYGYTFTVDDLQYIKNFMSECSCYVMLNVDYVGYTREEFNEFFKFAYPKNYSLNTSKKKKNIYAKYHLILCNY